MHFPYKAQNEVAGRGIFFFVLRLAFKYQDLLELYGPLGGFIRQNLLLNSSHGRDNPLSWCCYYITSLKN